MENNKPNTELVRVEALTPNVRVKYRVLVDGIRIGMILLYKEKMATVYVPERVHIGILSDVLSKLNEVEPAATSLKIAHEEG